MNRTRLMIAMLILSFTAAGQENLVAKSPNRNLYFIHAYPSALVAGDIALGLEHMIRNKFGQELSFNIKQFQNQLDHFDQGFRIDYFAKYNLYNGKKFRFSSLLALSYQDISFKNKEIEYYFVKMHPQNHDEIYQILIEDRRKVQYGCGLGVSLNFRVYKNLSIGGDVVANAVNYRQTHNYDKIIYFDPDFAQLNRMTTLSTTATVHSGLTFSPLLRFKVSYTLGKA